jgi:hypothetical protein
MRPDCDKDRTMSTRTKKTVATSLSPEEVIALDRVRKRDNLTRAQALREAIRRYVSQIPTGRYQSRTHSPMK